MNLLKKNTVSTVKIQSKSNLGQRTYTYSPIAVIPASKVNKIKLTNQQIRQFDNLTRQVSSGSITMEEAILQIRGGDGLTDLAAVFAFVIFINLYNSYFGVKGFQPNYHLPHLDPVGWMGGKYSKPHPSNSQCPSYPPSRFDRETLHRIKHICTASADENGFVMTYDEAMQTPEWREWEESVDTEH